MTLIACFHKEENEVEESSDDSHCSSLLNISVNIQRIFPNLNFSQPLAMLQAPGDPNRWYIVEKGGHIYWFNSNDTPPTHHLYIDLSNIVDTRSEGGLLGMAFHPEYATNGYVYLSFTEPGNAPNSYPAMHSYVSRFTRGNTETLNPASRFDIITVPQPYTNHNGGNILFGPDGFLYFGLGDGGSANDPLDHGQNTSTLLGALLRFDINSQTPYAIPQDNPFYTSGGRPEIYAYGLRNPWRWSFDRQNGTLWLADVGQNQYEEIDIIVKGGNYGWRCYEGLQITNNHCNTSGPYIPPVAVYTRDEGISVTGGYVYRGSVIPALNGVYIFGDFGTGNIWGLFAQAAGQYQRKQLGSSTLNISSFAESHTGELYIVDYKGGLYQIVPAANCALSPSGVNRDQL